MTNNLKEPTWKYLFGQLFLLIGFVLSYICIFVGLIWTTVLLLVGAYTLIVFGSLLELFYASIALAFTLAMFFAYGWLYDKSKPSDDPF